MRLQRMQGCLDCLSEKHGSLGCGPSSEVSKGLKGPALAAHLQQQPALHEGSMLGSRGCMLDLREPHLAAHLQQQPAVHEASMLGSRGCILDSRGCMLDLREPHRAAQLLLQLPPLRAPRRQLSPACQHGLVTH